MRAAVKPLSLVKRLLEITASAIAVALALPFLLLLCLGVRINLGAPIFFRKLALDMQVNRLPCINSGR
jgi:lipopolysaccharide/colanic/teichoic acid biosynthesis glycosyltransferase